MKNLKKLLIGLVFLSTNLFSQTTFSEQAASWGINQSGSKDGGTSFADYDNDGDLDLLVHTTDGTQASRIYRNNGAGTYTDVTSTVAPGLLAGVKERCAVWGDLNNDGRLDFLRNASYSGLEVYIQSSTGIFGDGTGATSPLVFNSSNVSDGLNSEGAGFVDYDGDGDLDLIFDNHDYGVDILRNNYINHATGAVVNPAAASLFTHVTPGTTTIIGLNQTAIDGDYGSFTDVNDDGWVDIFMRKQNENDFFLNQGGTFTNGADLAEASNNNKGAVALYDFDNDGDFDAFWTENGLNQIFRNDGAGVWTALGSATGIPTGANGIDEVSCGDLDNDGDIDILLVGDSRSYLYYNQLNSPSGGIGTGSAMDFVLDNTQSFNTSDGEGTTMIDIDDDGDLDIYMNINGSNNQLWINGLYDANTLGGTKKYLMVEVLEDRSFMQSGKKRPALGATIVLLDCNNNVLSGIREVNGGGGHGTQTPNRVHFGLPQGNNFNYKVLVKYPNYKIGGTTTRNEVIKWINPSTITTFPITVTTNSTDSDSNCPPVLEICTNGIDDDGDGLIDCADPDCYLVSNTGGTDSDNDGIDDYCDQDDDNDGILDVTECPAGTNSGLTGPLKTFTTSITSSTSTTDGFATHTLNSITYNGITYTDLVLPDLYTPNFTLTTPTSVGLRQDGNFIYNIGSNVNYATDILQDAFRSRNLNAYQQLDGNDFTNGDHYILNYTNPLTSTAGGFIAATERLGNNEQLIEALDINNNVIGTIKVDVLDYVDLGVNVYGSGSQNSNMALYPIDDLVPVGTKIYGVKVSFGSSVTATGDGPDSKVFFFGDFSAIACDYDGDGIPNNLDPDSDNDGCPDAIEGAGSFTPSSIDVNDRLTGGVGIDGIPNVVGAGQGLGSSQNENIGSCVEICNDGIDNDGDGNIDIADSDCACSGIAQSLIWMVDEESGGSGDMTLWSFSDYGNANTGVSYGSLKYQHPVTGIIENANDAGDMEALAVNPYTGIAYFFSTSDIDNGPSGSQALFSYNLSDAANNAGNIVLTPIGHISRPNGVAMEALAFDPNTNRFYTASEGNGTTVDDLYYIDLNNLNTDVMQVTNPTLIGAISGAGETNTYVDGLEFDDSGNLYAIDGIDDELHQINRTTGAIIAVLDNNLAGGTGKASVDIETIAWDVNAQKMIAVDNRSANQFLIELDMTQNGNNTVLMNYTDASGMPSDADFEGSAMLNPCTPKMSLGNLVFKDNNSNNVFTSGEGLDGVIVELYQSGANPATTSAIAKDVTSGGGFYLFENLAEGSYFVHLPASEFANNEPLFGLLSLGTTGGDNGTDDDDNGLDAANSAVNGISSIVVALTTGGEPTNGITETGAGNTMDDVNDGNGDMTIDFGFFGGIEDCTNGTDDDGDGLIDCADPDCAAIVTNVAITQPTCTNKTGGQIVITATGSGTLTYSINNVASYQASNTFSNLGVGQYTIRVKNGGGCVGEYTSNPVVLDITNCTEICDDGIDNDGDGLIDCDDPDCEDVGSATGIDNN